MIANFWANPQFDKINEAWSDTIVSIWALICSANTSTRGAAKSYKAKAVLKDIINTKIIVF